MEGEKLKDQEKERRKEREGSGKEKEVYWVASVTLGTAEQCPIIRLTFFIVCNCRSFCKWSVLCQE